MSAILSYMPMVLDILMVLFVIVCLKVGYTEGVSGGIKVMGITFALVISIFIAEIIWPIGNGLARLFVLWGADLNMESDALQTVAELLVFIIFAIILFVILMIFGVFLSKKVDEYAQKLSGKKRDKVFGFLITGVLSFSLIFAFILICYDMTNVISVEQMNDTRILLFLSDIL